MATHLETRSSRLQSTSASPPRKWYLAISPNPLRYSRGGSVSSTSVSHSTADGCQKAPTRFFPSGTLTPVFPPMAASTCPNSVVATATQRTPRWYTAAANPAVSVTTPPPTATTTSPRVRPQRENCRHRSSTVSRSLPASPSPIRNILCSTPASTWTPMPSCVTTA